jgi:hypothetical protein
MNFLTGMVTQCKLDAKTTEVSFFGTVVQLKAIFDSIFGSHLHFAFFSTHFLLFLQLSGTLRVTFKMIEKCKNATNCKKRICKCSCDGS